MANPVHLDILKQSMKTWNTWRYEYPDILPDLSGADLSEASLSGYYFGGYLQRKAPDDEILPVYTDLTNANLRKTDFSKADLSNARLRGANLSEANFADAILAGANLSKTDLIGAFLSDANMRGANLQDANLTHACLTRVYLNGANLTGADLTVAVMARTAIGMVDLRHVRGLDTITHLEPSSIGIDTIYASHGNIPEAFLKGAGVDDTFITYIRSLVGKPIEYYSCFISYSNRDEPFARRLYADLQGHNVRCWFAPEDLKIGDKFRHRIDESIRVYDKLLLVLSQASLASTWVSYEVEKALDKEPEGKPNVLFPIRLDKAILTCETEWAKDIRNSRHIGDFERWKEHDAYQIAFKRLLRDLKAQS